MPASKGTLVEVNQATCGEGSPENTVRPVVAFGEHSASPHRSNETYSLFGRNSVIHHRLRVPRVFLYSSSFTYALYFVIAIVLEVIYIAIT